MSVNPVLVNLVLFKAGWVAVVASAAGVVPLAGTLAIAAIALVRVSESSNRRSFRGGPRMNIPAALLAAALAGLAGGAIAKEPRLPPDDGATWQFRVFLDDREIGFHRFELVDAADGLKLETEASFDVRFLFINAFRYRHRNVEIWNGGCLERLEAVTDNNGERLEVKGERRDGAFTVATRERNDTLPGCVASFAYWNPAILEASRLLNAQTGEYENVEVGFEADDRVRVGGRHIAALRYRLETEAGAITLWYAKNSRRWLALEAPAKGGRRLRYEPVELPGPGPVDRLAADAAPASGA